MSLATKQQTRLIILIITFQILFYNSTVAQLYNNSTFIKTIDLSRPVGVIKGNHSVSSTGAASYEIPIGLPPGTNGLVPSLSLSYNSQLGNGVAGYGWTIAGLSTISRAPKDKYHDGIAEPVKLSGDDRFVLDGIRLLATSGTYGANGTTYATESENFSIITSFGSSASGPTAFNIYTKEGTILEYGNTTDSRIVGPSGKTMFWRLNKITDNSGNYILFSYDNTDYDSRISEINYTGNSNTALLPYNKMKFYYTGRIDQNTMYDGGEKMNLKYKLDRIEITGQLSLPYKIYQLYYGDDGIYTFLKDVEETGADGTKLNTTMFKYGEFGNEFNVSSSTAIAGIPSTNMYSGDFDGDGLSDILTVSQDCSTYTGLCVNTDISIRRRTVSNSSYSLTNYIPITHSDEVFNKRRIPTSHQAPISNDYNGDGRDDILLHDISVPTTGAKTLNKIKIKYSDGATFVDHDYWPPVVGGYTFDKSTDISKMIYSGDFDGDGRCDYITFLSDGGYYRAFYSKPSINDLNKTVYYHLPPQNPIGTAREFVDADDNIVIDFNGDGKNELMHIKNNVCKIFEIGPNTSNPTYGDLEFVPIYTLAFPGKYHNIFLGDFNGDKKTDLLTETNSGVWEIAYSNGIFFEVQSFSFNDPVIYTLKPNTPPYPNTDDKITIADVNGDGKSDIIHMYTNRSNSSISDVNVYYSRGNSFYYRKYNYNASTPYPNLIISDLNGDGRSELIARGNAYWDPFNILSFKADGKELLLEKVKNGVDATIEFQYKRLNEDNDFYTRGSIPGISSNLNAGYPLNEVQFPIYNVSSVAVPNGNGGTIRTSYKYEECKVHRVGKGLLGYSRIISSTIASNTKNIADFEFNTTYYTSAPKGNRTFDLGTDNLIAEVLNTNSFIARPGGGFFARTDHILHYDALANTQKNTSNTFDNFGNITFSTTNINGIETISTSTSYVSASTPIPSKPSYLTITKTRTGEPSVASSTSYAYNGMGYLITKVDFAGKPLAVTTNYTYNSFGNILTEQVSASGVPTRTTTYGYDSRGRFNTSITKSCTSCGTAFSNIELYNYHPLWGQPISHTSTDCQYTSFQYDGFGRLIQTTMPTGVIINNSTGWSLSGNEVSYSLTQHPGRPDVKIYYDKIGRERRQLKQVFGSQWATTITTYDNKGRLLSKTNQHIVGSETPVTNTYSYDMYNRLSTITNPTGTTYYYYTYASNGNLTSQTILPDGKNKKVITDPTEKVIGSIDDGGGVAFFYDSWGNQKEVRQNGTVAVQKDYDTYSRQIKVKDINAGTANFTYNAYGEMISQTDANGNFYQMTYDELGRLISRVGPEGTTSYQYYCKIKEGSSGTGSTSIEYCCNNNIAKITGFNGIVEEFVYDVYARLLQKKEIKPSATVVTTYTYDVYDNKTSVIFPSGQQLLYDYDPNGYLLTIDRTGTGNIYTCTSMNGQDQELSALYGNGGATVNTYQYGLPVTSQSATPAGMVQDWSLTWDFTTGNLLQRQDNIKGLTEDFTYDASDRLTSSQVVGQPIANYTYDNTTYIIPTVGIGPGSAGNIMVKDDAGNYDRYYPQRHAVGAIHNPASTTLPPVNISPIQQDIAYTGFNKPGTITEGIFEKSFDYFPDYTRSKSVLKQGGAVVDSREYYGDYEVVSKGGATYQLHYVTGNNGICAIIVTSSATNQVYYVYKDHLGSFLTVTDPAGVVVAEQNFDAWGRKRNPTNWTYASVPTNPDWLIRGYTGHEHMPEFELINMNGRMYDPINGRMLSPDNFVSDPLSAQAYNRYSYANNNPLSYVDQSGNIPALAVLGIYMGAFGVTNLAVNAAQGNVNNFGDGAKAFGIGALQGAVAFMTAGVGSAATMPTGWGWTLAGNCALSFGMSYFPAIQIPISKSFTFTMRPSFGFNIQGNFMSGLSAGLNYSEGDWNIGIGLSTTGGLDGSTETRLGGGVSYLDDKKRGASLGVTSFGGNYSQMNWQVGITYGDFSFKMTNDYDPSDKLPNSNNKWGDKFRTASAEIGIGDFSYGFSLWTTQTGDDKYDACIIKDYGKIKSKIWGNHSKAYKWGQRISSGMYLGYRNGNAVYRVGIDAPFVQDFFQNGIHKNIVTSPYFLTDYGSRWRVYANYKSYDPYSLY